jgi:hypothetical protein
MRRIKDVAKTEGQRWKRLFLVLIGRGVEPIDSGDDADKEAMDESHHDTRAVVASVAADTERREREAQRALTNIRHLYHEADQPITVAKAKASMLKRVARGG